MGVAQVESLLDEATAEVGKMEFSPMLATIEIEFKITKAVPLHTTLRIACEARRAWLGRPPHVHAAGDGAAAVCVVGFALQLLLIKPACILLSQVGARHDVSGGMHPHVCMQIKEVRGMRCWVSGSVKDPEGALLASCIAQLVDLQQLWAAQR